MLNKTHTDAPIDLSEVCLNDEKLRGYELFEAPMSWLPPNHPALSPFDPERFEHHRTKLDRPTVVIRGLTDENRSPSDQSGLIVKRESNGFVAIETCIPDEDANDDCAHIDTCSIVFSIDNYEAVSNMIVTDSDLLALVSSDWASMVGLKIGERELGKKNFYQNTRALTYCDTEDGISVTASLGFVAWGGNNRTFQVYLNGDGCEHINTQSGGWNKIKAWGENIRGKLTRTDLAFDDMDGKYFDVRKANQMRLEGMYNNPNGGRTPCFTQFGDWLNNDEAGKGLTAGIGSRNSSRYFRIYEKGKEMGDPSSPWVRAELELKSNNFYIPWDVLIEPGKYLAGSCKAMSVVSEERIVMRNIRKAKIKATIDRMKDVCRHQYGKLINALSELGYSSERIISELRRDGLPKGFEIPLEGKNPYQRSYSYDFDTPDPFALELST